ncbi:MFS transporter [Nocardia sp. NPDC052566]|uniref:MFS transporter n=1 Tax=Nocardia sp. NPDC052566 TaxID=3364330 RepID=UPI0037C70F3A
MTDSDLAHKRAAGAVDPARVLAMCSGITFMAFLDFTVVNIAFPDILADFENTSINTLTWIVSGYAVMFAALLAPAGRIADSVGRRPVLLWSLALFTIASLVCGVAPSIGWLIAGRFLQGVAAGGMIPAALGLILSTTPRERIPRAVATWSAASGFSAVIGPAVGGVLLRVLDWRWVFFINLPIGAALLAGGLAVLPGHVKGSGSRLPDAIGSIALGLGIAGIVSALTEGDKWGWLDIRTIGLGAAGLALIGFTVLRSRAHEAPAIDIALWRSPAYTIANVALAMLSANMFAWNLAAPLFATTIWHWTILETAAALCVGAVASMIGSLAAGRLTSPAMHGKIAILACLLFAASNAIWASNLFGSTSNFLGGWLPAAILGGGGLGLGFTCLSTLAAGALAPLKFAGGLGMTVSVRQVGGAVGVAGFAAIMVSSATPGSLSAFHHVFVAAMALNIICALVVSVLISPRFSRPAGARTATGA